MHAMSAPASLRIRTELLLLAAFCGFLFFYGLGALGLVGADEPRYAQVAREMLDRSDWVTPTLNGKPWLEKPALYYWEAMLSYEVGKSFLAVKDGVSEQTARFPGAVDAALLVIAIYFFLRRFRPGSELDGALITASCAGMIGFAHAAATDMPLTASFGIALLAWFDWYESRRRASLAFFYIGLALGTLAKGPIAPALAAVIVLIFLGLRREWSVLLRTLWIPGIVLFFAVGLPWYVAVQSRNPEFFRVFILEHNLARFSSNVYHHPQPFWFYLPVFLLAVAPWAVWLVAAVAERVRQFAREGRAAFASAEDAWPLFLLIWMVVSVLFFSSSQSKLPGYILPAVPAAALLVTEYLSARREGETRISLRLAAAHGILCGALVFGALSAASIALNHHLVKGTGLYIAAAVGAMFALGITGALVTRNGICLVRSATMIAVIVSVAAVIRFATPALDATQSTRPVAQSIQGLSREAIPIAVYHTNRITEYGLDFYFNRPTQKYENRVPVEEHVLVAASGTDSEVRALLGGRKVSYLTSIPLQKLSVYWVGKQ
jgi:4-amino-4-deoxy-L-arabinose transferase-like glycosyltransferase